MLESNALVPSTTFSHAPILLFTPPQIALIKNTVCKKATDDELQLFLYTCKRTGLDPLTRQIYAVKRANRKTGEEQMAIQVGIDGYRLIADRTGLYAGSDDYRFDEGLTEYEHIQKQRGNPTTATVTVWKLAQGQRSAFSATARWSEYYPGATQGFMWEKMPYLMIGKCAEALALRKAFPAELSGLYVTEEMQQASNTIELGTSAATPATEPPPGHRLILSRFPGLCRQCHKTVSKGEQVWYSKEVKGALCVACGRQPTAPVVEPPAEDATLASVGDSTQ